MKDKYKRLIRDMGVFALGVLGSKLITFLLLPLYTHVLTTDEYGVSDLVFTLGQLILPVISLAIFNGLLRYGLMRENKPEDVLNCATRVFFIGSIVAVCLTPLLRFVPSLSEWRWFLCAYVISSFAVTNSLVYLKVKDKNNLYAIFSILQTVVLVVGNIVFLVVLSFGVRGFLLSYIISNFVTVIFAFIFGGMVKDLRVSKYRSDLIKSMILFSLPYILNDVSWWAIHSSNKLMIEFILGSAILGIYTTASKIPSLINVVSSIFTQAWGLSSIKEYDSTGESDFYSNVFYYFILVIFGACVCVVSVIKIFMKIYVSESFFVAWQYIPLLLLGAVFSAVSAFAGSLLGAMKKPQNLMWTTLVAGVINIALNLILIPIIGLWGAAIGTLVANVVVAVFRLINVKKNLKVNYNLKRTVPIMVIVFVHAILVGLDFHIVIVSAISITLFLSIIYKDIIAIINMIIKKRKSN